MNQRFIGRCSVTEREGPDFICIGLQKAGTQWLYDQLQFHPDFWMTPIKELNFFFPQFLNGSAAKAARRFERDPEKALAASNAKRVASDARPLDQRDTVFFQEVSQSLKKQKKRSVDDYARLFIPKGVQLSGDVTPRFSVMKEKHIYRIAKRFPTTKVIMMLRDPVERAWSQWRMVISRDQIPASDEQNVEALRRFFDHKFNYNLSYPTKIAARWREAFGEDRFHYFFLDDVAKNPGSVREAIITLLGGDPAKPSSVDPGFNRKAKPEPSSRRSEAVQEFMKERFERERRRCAKIFGGPARLWPDAPY
jgi:hypothetical protein